MAFASTSVTRQRFLYRRDAALQVCSFCHGVLEQVEVEVEGLIETVFAFEVALRSRCRSKTLGDWELQRIQNAFLFRNVFSASI